MKKIFSHKLSFFVLAVVFVWAKTYAFPHSNSPRLRKKIPHLRLRPLIKTNEFPQRFQLFSFISKIALSRTIKYLYEIHLNKLFFALL